jgi:hypothetical protein
VSKKYSLSVSIVLLLTLTAISSAAVTYNQYSGPANGDWNTGANWALGHVPTTAEKAGAKTAGGPLVVTSTPACGEWTLGGTAGGIITINAGGSVSTVTSGGGTGRVSMGQSAGENGTLQMNGGTATFAGILDLGYAGTGLINLYGGTINTADFAMRRSGGVGTMNITAGTLIIAGDKVSLINSYVTSGWIKAYNSLGDVVVDFNSNANKTTLTGVMDTSRARGPYPANMASKVAPYVLLSWTAGDGVATHDVYFGTDANSVLDADTSTVGIYQGSQLSEETSFEPTGLELGKRYYWRVDEVNDPCFYKGNLWQFLVANYSLVDDFEKYADTNTLLLSWSNTGTGGALSLATTGGHDEAKTMKFDYNNSGEPNYSEAQTNDIDYDWTIAGVVAVDIWYKGDANNAAEQMYAALEDNNSNPVAVVENGDPNAIKSSNWQVWRIKLTDFTGVNLANIKKFYLGFGDRNNPVAGGTGTVYFDDIRLHLSRCINNPVEDLNDDCVIDFKDFAIMANNWMKSSRI